MTGPERFGDVTEVTRSARRSRAVTLSSFDRGYGEETISRRKAPPLMFEDAELDERRIGRAERLRNDQIRNARARDERDRFEGHSRNEEIDSGRARGASAPAEHGAYDSEGSPGNVSARCS